MLDGYEQITLPSGVVEHKYSVGDAIITKRSNGANETYYLHKDQQGSTTAITNAAGNTVQQLMYDPWGKQYVVNTSLLTYTSPAQSKGYTGHEMVNDFEVIHMGGRTYNPVLGRFMQADPFIQSPTNLQSYNRYSYVLNNPMSYTDPSGYIFKKLNKMLGKFAPFAGFALLLIPGVGAWAAANWYQAAMFGFMSGGVATGSLRGAVVGAISGAAFQHIGASFKGKGFFAQGGAGHIGTHAVAGGVSSVLGGGKFGHGFWSAGLTKGLDVNSLIPGIGDGLNAARAIVAALVGGTISELTGGKFANGAVTAGIAQAVNGNSFWDDAGMLAEMAKDFMPGAALLDCVKTSCSNAEWALAHAEVAAIVIPGGVAVRVAFKAFQKWKAASQVGESVGKTVLGHFPEYKNLADSIGARRFNIPENVWSKMSDAERWTANQKFLDRMISRGDDVMLSTALDKVRPGSYFARELEYLAAKGYRPSADGSRLIRGN